MFHVHLPAPQGSAATQLALQPYGGIYFRGYECVLDRPDAWYELMGRKYHFPRLV